MHPFILTILCAVVLFNPLCEGFTYPCFQDICNSKLLQLCDVRSEIQRCRVCDRDDCLISICGELSPHCDGQRVTTPSTTTPSYQNLTDTPSSVDDTTPQTCITQTTLIAVVAAAVAAFLTWLWMWCRRRPSDLDSEGGAGSTNSLKQPPTSGVQMADVHIEAKDERGLYAPVPEADQTEGGNDRTQVSYSGSNPRHPIENYVNHDTNIGAAGPSECVPNGGSIKRAANPVPTGHNGQKEMMHYEHEETEHKLGMEDSCSRDTEMVTMDTITRDEGGKQRDRTLH